MRRIAVISICIGLTLASCTGVVHRRFGAFDEVNRHAIIDILDAIDGTDPAGIITITRSYDFAYGTVIKRTLDKEGVLKADKWTIAYPSDGPPYLSERHNLYSVCDPGITDLFRSILSTNLIEDAPDIHTYGATASTWHLIGSEPIVVEAECCVIHVSSVKNVLTLADKLMDKASYNQDVFPYEDDILPFMEDELYSIGAGLNGHGVINLSIELLDKAGIALSNADNIVPDHHTKND